MFLYFFGILVLGQSFLVHGYVSKCLVSGFKCTSCQELVHCVDTLKGFKTNVIATCDNTKNQYCSAEIGGCVSDANVCQIFGLPKIQCQGIGLFPDPYDCNSYHMCKEENGILVSEKHNCPEDRGFDSITGMCIYKTTHRACRERPIPKCEHPLQTASLPENPRMYYVCVPKDGTLEPWIYKCDQHNIFANHACKIDFTCTEVGNFADPTDRQYYLECGQDLKFKRKKCRPGTYFEEKEKNCVKEEPAKST